MLHTSDKQFSARECGVSDALKIQNLDIRADFRHIAYQGRYTDQWDVKGKSTLDIATIGFESEFRYITLGIDVSSLPFVKSTLAVHPSNSLFSLSTSIARGSVDIGNISWIPSKEYEQLVSTISVDWESHFLYRSLSAEISPGIHHLELSGALLQTSPRNPDKEYYVRDSVNAIIARAGYGFALGQDHLKLAYTFADADATLYGIFHQEKSRKRFMFVPLEARLHWASAEWERGNLKADMNYVRVSGRIKANQNRFFETLAPNRALPTSLLKSLSFSFLQKMFRVDADLDAYGILGGTAYRWHFGRKYSFNPGAGIEAYYANGTLDIDKSIETQVLFAYSKDNESYRRELKSAGGILSLGAELCRKGDISVALDYGIAQLIPVYSSYKEILPDDKKGDATSIKETTPADSGQAASGDSEQKKSGDLETKTGAVFRNGFATHLAIKILF